MKTLPALMTAGILFGLHAEPLQAENAGDPQFTAELYSELRKGYGNVVISPHGIASSLAMLYGGARGVTASEMAGVLRFSGSQSDVALAFGRRDAQVNSGANAFSTSLWMRQGNSYLPAFSQLCENSFRADLRTTNFAGSPEATRKEINQWVVVASGGVTDEFLRRSDLNPRAELILMSVSQFKGASGFSEGGTMPFRLEGGRSRGVPMLSQTGDFRYADLGDVQLIELPCSPAGQSMLIALPTDPNGLPALERRLAANPELMSEWRKSLRPASVTVTLPKFKVVYNYSLNQALREMGMKTAFTSAADFSGVNGSQGLSLTQVLHRTIVEVGEFDGGGSAKDGLVGSAKGYEVPGADSTAPAFNADRPFLYSVGDGAGDTFMGRVGDPGYSGPPGIWYGGRTTPFPPSQVGFPVSPP